MKKLLSLLLAATLLMIAAPPISFAADGAPLHVAVISDIHYFPEKFTGNYCQAFLDSVEKDNRQPGQSVALLDAALDAVKTHALEMNTKYLLIPGDMSHDGEYGVHEILAQRLEQFEQDTGIQIIVINGNHDIGNSGAITFENGVCEKAQMTTSEDFLELYKNLGYDLAYHTYTPTEGAKAGMLSYSVRLSGGYRLIAMDYESYSGNPDATLLEWIKAEAADAAACGEVVIGMTHHSVVPQFDIAPTVMPSILIDDYLTVSEALADAGMRYVFTGHTHMCGVATGVSDSGNTLTDIMTASLTGYPNTFREVTFDNADGAFTANIKTFDPDCTKLVTYLDTTYEFPYRNTFGYWQSFGQDGLIKWGTDVADHYISKYLEAFLDKGLAETLRENGFDPGDGAFSDVLDTLTAALEENYLKDPARLYKVLDKAFQHAGTLKVSEFPCTKFIDTIGFGDPNRPGDFEDFGMSLLVYLYDGDEYIEDDPFAADVLAQFQSGEMTSLLLHTIASILVDDLLLYGLPTLVLPPETADIQTMLTDAVETLLLAMLGENVDPSVFTGSKALGDALAVYAATCGMSEDLAYWIESLLTDSNPGVKMDKMAFVSYTGPVAAPATAQNGRLPSQVTVTGAEGINTDKTVSWLTKYSVTASDIEIITGDGTEFTGIPTTDFIVSQTGTPVQNEYYALHLAPGTGAFAYTLSEIQHGVALSGLLPDTVYRFRVGDAEKGWWSEEYTFETNTDGGIDYDSIAELTALFERLSAILKIIVAFS